MTFCLRCSRLNYFNNLSIIKSDIFIKKFQYCFRFNYFLSKKKNLNFYIILTIYKKQQMLKC